LVIGNWGQHCQRATGKKDPSTINNWNMKIPHLSVFTIILFPSHNKITTHFGMASEEPPSHPRLSKRNKIILLGDSITQLSFSASLSGWGAHISDIYQRRCDVYNRGMSGYNTDWFLKYINSPTGKYDVFDSMTDPDDSVVKLVTIFFGANDASCENLNPRHHVPTDRFESNLKEIIRLCRLHYGEKVRIILITPPPVHHDSRLRFQIEKFGDKATGELERSLDLSQKYAQVVEKVAKEMNLPCLNLWSMMQEAMPGEDEPWGIFFNDGLHFSKEGNTFVGEKIVDLIQNHFPEIAVTPCPYTNYCGNSSSKGGSALGSEYGIGPWHDEIDHFKSDVIFEQTCSSSMK